jgi:hypothetical protein
MMGASSSQLSDRLGEGGAGRSRVNECATYPVAGSSGAEHTLGVAQEPAGHWSTPYLCVYVCVCVRSTAGAYYVPTEASMLRCATTQTRLTHRRDHGVQSRNNDGTKGSEVYFVGE